MPRRPPFVRLWLYTVVVGVGVCTWLAVAVGAPVTKVGRAQTGPHARLSAFVTAADALIQESAGLRTQPGWPAMVAIIITTTPSRPDPAGHTDAARQLHAALATWSRTWHSDGLALYRHYLTLVARSQALHRQQSDLLETWGQQQKKLSLLLLAVHGADASARAPLLLAALATRAMSVTAAVQAYTINAVGLYEKR